MKLELNTNMIPFFSGTYGSIWEVEETDEDGNEVEVEYKFNDLMKSIVDKYQDRAEEIVRDMGIPWIESIKFTGSHSPKYYNFSTDGLDFDIEIDETLMKQSLMLMPPDMKDKFNSWLRDHFSSCDGFISWTPNSYAGIVEAIDKETSEYDQAISALITFLATRDTLDEIEMSVYEDWRGNGYGGLDYKIVEEETE